MTGGAKGHGLYRTEYGSTMRISGANGGISEVEFDWFEEDGACCDCRPEPYADDGFLVWRCNLHRGKAQLFRVDGR